MRKPTPRENRSYAVSVSLSGRLLYMVRAPDLPVRRPALRPRTRRLDGPRHGSTLRRDLRAGARTLPRREPVQRDPARPRRRRDGRRRGDRRRARSLCAGGRGSGRLARRRRAAPDRRPRVLPLRDALHPAAPAAPGARARSARWRSRTGAATSSRTSARCPVRSKIAFASCERSSRTSRASTPCSPSRTTGSPAGSTPATSDREPAAETIDEDGVEHRLWIADPDPAVAGWLDSASLMIADGHHRYETALRYRDEMRARRGPGPVGPRDDVRRRRDDGAAAGPALPSHPARGRRARGGATRPRPRGGPRDRGRRRARLRDRDARARSASCIASPSSTADPPAVSRLHEQVLDGLDGLPFHAGRRGRRGGGAKRRGRRRLLSFPRPTPRRSGP